MSRLPTASVCTPPCAVGAGVAVGRGVARGVGLGVRRGVGVGATAGVGLANVVTEGDGDTEGSASRGSVPVSVQPATRSSASRRAMNRDMTRLVQPWPGARPRWHPGMPDHDQDAATVIVSARAERTDDRGRPDPSGLSAGGAERTRPASAPAGHPRHVDDAAARDITGIDDGRRRADLAGKEQGAGFWVHTDGASRDAFGV